MAPPLKVNAIALVSALNHPIIVRSFNPGDSLKYNYVAHTSLDVIEERSQQLCLIYRRRIHKHLNIIVALGPKFMDCYLGHLYSMEDVAVYGYITPTRVKIILALELEDAVVRDADVVAVCRRGKLVLLPMHADFSPKIFKAVHAAYNETMSNPFLRLNTMVDSTADPSSLLVMQTREWKGLERRIDGIGRAIGSLPPTPTS